MNILIDNLPKSVFIDGVDYAVNTDFRYCVLFELLMQDKSVTDSEKMDAAIALFFEEAPTDLEASIEFILWFYSCGKDNPKPVHDDQKTETTNKKQAIYSFEHDADYIYAAFLDQYNIDLNVESLHWWKFKALFKALKADVELVKIMGYRAMEIDKDMSRDMQKHYTKLKQIYALPDDRTEEEKESGFAVDFASMF